jgi:hypothetical protein
MSNFYVNARSCPPWLCRLLARKGVGRGRRAMSNREIAAASGLSPVTVGRLSHKKTWSNVNFRTVERFTKGCGVNLNALGRQRRFLRSAKLVHLRIRHAKQRKFLAALGP